MLTLYHSQNSPDCEKVRFALDHLGLEWEGVVVPPGDQPQTPLLRDEGKDVTDSTHILEHLAEHHDSSLLSTNPLEQGLAALLEDWADEVFSKIVAQSRRIDRITETLDTALQNIDLALHEHSYLVGDGLSAADIAAFAHICSLPDETRVKAIEPYVNLRDWYFNIADYRAKSQGSKGSALFDE